MSSLQPGDQLDHYRIDSLVARSGMASIYRATDLHTGRAVAIKLPHQEMEADPSTLKRLTAMREKLGDLVFDAPEMSKEEAQQFR